MRKRFGQYLLWVEMGVGHASQAVGMGRIRTVIRFEWSSLRTVGKWLHIETFELYQVNLKNSFMCRNVTVMSCFDYNWSGVRIYSNNKPELEGHRALKGQAWAIGEAQRSSNSDGFGFACE